MPGSHEGCAHHLEDGGSFVVKYEKLSDAALAEPAAAPLVGAWRDVADRFKTAASMHVYVTGSGGKALPPHTDTTDVLVAQLRGTKEWQVCAPSKDKAPFASTAFRAELLEAERGSHGCSQFEQELRDEPEACCETYVLAPGDSLYLPKGVAHSAVATDDSAHLTVGLKRVTWRKVFDELLDRPGLFGAESGWANRRLFSVFRGQKAPPTRRARAKRALKTLEAAGDASAVPWRRAFPTWTLGFDGGQAVPGRDAYQQRDALAKALVEALGGDEDLAHALADDDRFVDAVRATFESPKSLGSQPAVLDAGACDEYAFVSGATRRRATTADVDWGGHAPVGQCQHVDCCRWNHCNVHVDRQPRRLGVCQRGRLQFVQLRRRGGEGIDVGADRGRGGADDRGDDQILWVQSKRPLHRRPEDRDLLDGCGPAASPTRSSSATVTATARATNVMRVATTTATKTATKTQREITATNTMIMTVDTDATKTVPRAATTIATITATEAATEVARARTPTPRPDAAASGAVLLAARRAALSRRAPVHTQFAPADKTAPSSFPFPSA